MFGEVCHCLNMWMASMSQKIACKENYDMDLMKECSTFLNDGLNRAVLAFSGIETKRNDTKRLLAKIYYSPQSKVSVS